MWALDRVPRGLARGAIGVVLAAACLLGPTPARAEDGYELWLRYLPVEDAEAWAAYRGHTRELVFEAASPTLEVARQELRRGLEGLLAVEVPLVGAPTGPGALVVGTPRSSAVVGSLDLGADLDGVGEEGFVIRSRTVEGRPAIVIAGSSDAGVLYGVFRFLRLIQTRRSLEDLALAEAPGVELRLLNHWDNLDRTVERGYAGFSLWDWHKLPEYVSPRYTDYARANASIGINGTVLTNVNANATALTARYLEKAAALADVFRPWGIRTYLTARFNAPMEIGGLETADPLDSAVRKWWTARAEEIYRRIPDFGGFLVKANSEGQPGPQDYGRTHAEGANMLADAVGPHGGVVIWRAFVYSDEEPDDRAKQAYNEFVPLDGRFRPNVLVQVKNGPIDFQPREPFHPLFGAMPGTPLVMEFQITQEYLGRATHLTYLAPLYEEALRADTFAQGRGSLISKVVDGTLHGYPVTGMAGVANTGTDRNWCGSVMACANWFAFGRLAWDPGLDSADIAEEWLRATFTNDPAFVEPVEEMMLASREAGVDYRTPLGLHHLMAEGHHWGPGPWVSGGSRADWTSVYYHRADDEGLGFDRAASGSDAVSQYFSPLPQKWGDLDTVPEEYLLWFHHVPWDHRLGSGRTLWDELLHRYQRGVDAVRQMQATWRSVKGLIDPERHDQVGAFLRIQEKEARWWRDACVQYFQTFSRRPIPEGYEPPEQSLEELIARERRPVPEL